MIRILWSVAALLLVSGCITPQQIEANKQQYCANLGAPVGSPNYYDCRKSLEQQLAAEQMQQAALKQQRENAARQESDANFQAMMGASGRSRNSLGSWGRDQTHCTSKVRGSKLYTDCY